MASEFESAIHQTQAPNSSAALPSSLSCKYQEFASSVERLHVELQVDHERVSLSASAGPAYAVDSEGARHFALFASARALCFNLAIFITALGSSSRDKERKLDVGRPPWPVATNVMLGFRPGYASSFAFVSLQLCRINRNFSEHCLSDSPPTINNSWLRCSKSRGLHGDMY